jgi:putative GTP pyrophosphokinase
MNLPLAPSKGEINRCGQLLKKIFEGEIPAHEFDDEEFLRAHTVVSDFRSAHQRALAGTTMGLRSMVRSEGIHSPFVSQRLKRVPRIIRKLARMGNSNLARLEDIGGCRAVLPDVDSVERVRLRLEKNWGKVTMRTRDYVKDPNPAGYRAHHYVVQRYDRRIEVQLRTYGQQAWADAVEAADSRHGITLKDGVGPESMIRYFQLANDMIYYSEHDLTAPPEASAAFEDARLQVIREGYYGEKGRN